MSVLRSIPPFAPLNDAACENGQPGLSEVATGICSVSAALAVMTGPEHLDVVRDDPYLAPSGLRGHDHSGGSWGRPFLRSICTSYVGPYVDHDANIEAGNVLFAASVSSAAGGTNHTIHGPSFPVIVPPCESEGAAFVDLGWVVAIHVSTATSDAGDVVKIRLYNRSIESRQGSAAHPYIETSGMAIDSTGAVYEECSGGTDRLRVRPGTLNIIGTEARIEYSAGGSNRSCTVLLGQVELGVHST